MMRYLGLQVGDQISLGRSRGLVGDELIEPRWHALRVAPLKERAAAQILNRSGVRAFFPREKRERVRNGKRYSVKHPQVTQIVYAKFRAAPNWDVLQERRIITGVFCIGTTPIVLPPDAIRVVQGLPTAAERVQAAKEALMRLHPGEQVELIEGTMSGFFVDVTREEAGRVWWKYVASNGMPIYGECDRSGVKKQNVAP